MIMFCPSQQERGDIFLADKRRAGAVWRRGAGFLMGISRVGIGESSAKVAEQSTYNIESRSISRVGIGESSPFLLPLLLQHKMILQACQRKDRGAPLKTLGQEAGSVASDTI